jgi:hypothetical protein
VIPTTYADVGSERWSWCESKWDRVKFKKSLADAAVDGIVPEDAEDAEYVRRTASYGDFSRMNGRWNIERSFVTHARLKDSPDEWQHYHSLYREARKTWAVVPFEEIIKELLLREEYVVGDFGCGEALLDEKLGDHCTVHSFDHVAVNDSVTTCDLADVPLDDGELDVAVFCLSLMGSNFTDYLREAHRTLKLDGRLHIYEATTRFSDRSQFTADLKRLGFGQISVEDEWKFTHIIASKDRLNPRHHIDKVRGL